MPKNMPDAYLSDDTENFRGLFFFGGHVDGLAVVLSQICGVTKIFRDDQAAILNQAEEAYSFRVIFNGTQKPVTSSYLTLDLARDERNALLVKLEKYNGGE